MNELKPCPFCGGKAELLHTGKYDSFVRCHRGCVEQIRLYKAKGSAVKAWNRRKETPEIISCESCKYADDKPINDGRRWCRVHSTYMEYCSVGEMKDDEE